MKKRVNVDAFNYLAESPIPNQPPVVRTGFRGEVIDVTFPEDIEKGKVLTTTHYPVGTTTVPREEPALVDPDYDTSASALAAVKEARVAQLQAEIAALSAGAEAPTLGTDGDGLGDEPEKPAAKAPAPPAPPKRR